MTRTMKSFGPDFIVYLVEGTRNTHSKKTMITPSIETDPLMFENAIRSQDVAFWKEAINNELEFIMENKTWKLVDLPPRSKPTRWK